MNLELNPKLNLISNLSIVYLDRDQLPTTYIIHISNSNWKLLLSYSRFWIFVRPCLPLCDFCCEDEDDDTTATSFVRRT